MPMENNIKSQFAEKVRDFRLPVYAELPNMGLYLEQVTKYINGQLSPLGFPEVTSSMISNYVKKGVVSAPVRKQYFAEHIAYLLFVCVGKSVVAIDDIFKLYEMQKKQYPLDVAYDYFCLEFKNMLMYVAGLKETVDSVGVTDTELKAVLRSVIICVSNLVFVTSSMGELEEKLLK